VLRRLRKTVPKKKVPQTDDIFKNVNAAHQRAKEDQSILRISIDNKAKVKLGPFSRGGKTRDDNELHAATADQLERWWVSRKHIYPSVRKLMIDLDNGPEVSSSSSGVYRQGLLQGSDVNQASFSKAKPVAQASG
jgi:Rhodopirellula transposase DDE domain